MSFSSDVKAELGRQRSKSRHCKVAELAGMLQMEGKISDSPYSIEFLSDNEVAIAKYHSLIENTFGLDDPKLYIEGDDAKAILRELMWIGETGRLLDMTAGVLVSPALVERVCCKRAFIRGAFMASGSMSDPNKSYHFEVVCRKERQAQQLKELMNSFDTEAKIVERKGHYVVYLKEGSQIVDMLNVMEAYVSLMNLENVRILKEMRNSVNRKVNCETANISKTVNAAVKQIEDIELIRKVMGLDKLPKNLKEMAVVRLENPEAPLKELGNYLEPKVGKSGVNHRLKKLGEIAEKLRRE